MLWTNFQSTSTARAGGNGKHGVLMLCICCVVVILTGVAGWLIYTAFPLSTGINAVGTIANTSQCTVLGCNSTACSYEGVLVLAYSYVGIAYSRPAAPQTVCGDDCCTSLMTNDIPIGVVFLDEQPDLVAYFTLDLTEVNNWGTFALGTLLWILAGGVICGVGVYCCNCIVHNDWRICL
jgi:hypothetical protein